MGKARKDLKFNSKLNTGLLLIHDFWQGQITKICIYGMPIFDFLHCKKTLKRTHICDFLHIWLNDVTHIEKEYD